MITHEEILSRKGDDMIRRFKQLTYQTLWVTTPSSWHSRSKRNESERQRLEQLISVALDINLTVIMFGPPGYVWRHPHQELLTQQK